MWTSIWPNSWLLCKKKTRLVRDAEYWQSVLAAQLTPEVHSTLRMINSRLSNTQNWSWMPATEGCDKFWLPVCGVVSGCVSRCYTCGCYSNRIWLTSRHYICCTRINNLAGPTIPSGVQQGCVASQAALWYTWRCRDKRAKSKLYNEC